MRIRIKAVTPVGTYESLEQDVNSVEYDQLTDSIEQGANSLTMETLEGTIIIPRGIATNSVIHIVNVDEEDELETTLDTYEESN